MTTKVLARAAETPAAVQDWWRGAVIYQVYPRSFADSNGDGVGDLAGAAARLDHVAALGADAVWLSPFFKSPMRDFGYDVSDYVDVDPIFGTMDDFDAFVARAHALGLKVLIDQVYSHTSNEHAWFEQSRQDRTNPKADWYVWADAKPDGGPPSNWQSVFGGPAWTWDARRRQYYLHNFLSEQPDLNVHCAQVQDALVGVMRFWLDRGVDGFRLDAANFMMHDPSLRDNPRVDPADPRPRLRPFDFQHHYFNQSHPDIPVFLGRLRALADEYGARFLIAEIGGERAAEEMKLYTQPPNGLHSAYNFHYLYASALTPALVREAVEMWSGEPDEGWPSWTFSNHDAPRAVSRWAPPQARKAFADLAELLRVAVPGTVIVYQGEELGLPQAHVPFERLQDPEAIANWPHTLGRDGARTPMPWAANAPNADFSTAEPWLPVDPAHAALAVDAQEDDPSSTLSASKRAIALRKRLAALRTGATRILAETEQVLVFVRGEGAEAVLCAFNLSDTPASWTPPPSDTGWRVAETANVEAAAALSGALPAYAGLIAARG